MVGDGKSSSGEIVMRRNRDYYARLTISFQVWLKLSQGNEANGFLLNAAEFHFIIVQIVYFVIYVEFCDKLLLC